MAIFVNQTAIGQAQPPQTGSTQTLAASPASAAAPVAVPDSYIIGPDDILYIHVWRDADLTGYYPVSPDGKITLPLIRDVPAAGLTREKLTSDLTTRLREKMVNPDVTIQLWQVNSKKYYITGQVNHRGSFPLTSPTTVFDALNGAGGFVEFAKMNKIVVARGDKRIPFNYQEVLKGKNLKQNILIQNGDTIIVP